VIEAFGTVLIALVHGIDADEAGAALGGGGAALTDGDAIALGLGPVNAEGLVAGQVAQVIPMRDGQAREPFVAGIPVEAVGTLHQQLGSGSGHGAVQRIGLSEQAHVSGGEFAGKAMRRGAIALGQTRTVEEAAHQPGKLLSRVARGALQIAQNRPLVGSAKPAIGKGA
jgi:hypothetical protein